MKKRKKRTLSTVILILVFLVGLSLLLYPTVSDYWNSLHQSRAIASYAEQVAALDNETYERLWEEARAYNETLPGKADRFRMSEEELAEYEQLLSVSGSNVIGYIEIEKIDCYLPIYHGTSESVLQVGVGHLEGSSLPTGGAGTHCVVSGHRGLPSAKLFTDIDQLGPGDRFYIHVLDEDLAYEVDQILPMVDKDDRDTLNEALQVVEGEDLVTLFTCTPYGVNTHRLLVRGHRVPYEGELEKSETPVDTMVESIQNYYMLYLLLGLAVTILVILLMRKDFVSRKKPAHRDS